MTHTQPLLSLIGRIKSMSLCKLTIMDEVNIKFDGLPVDVRRKISNALKGLRVHRHMPRRVRLFGKIYFLLGSRSTRRLQQVFHYSCFGIHIQVYDECS
jgi:hypothetical protein